MTQKNLAFQKVLTAKKWQNFDGYIRCGHDVRDFESEAKTS